MPSTYRTTAVDVVHAHQVLQHLTDPVAALREMTRVCRRGGVIAARDADYAGFTWYPQDTRLDAWLALYRTCARDNDAAPTPDAGCWPGRTPPVCPIPQPRPASGVSRPRPTAPGGEACGRSGFCIRR